MPQIYSRMIIYQNLTSVSDITQAEKSWVSRLQNPKLATIGQGTDHERPFGTPPRQLSGHIVAHEVAHHRDIPNFCIRVISDTYRN